MRSFSRVAAEQVDAAAVRVEDHGDQQAEFAIAQHGHGFARRDRDLVQDLAGGRQRFGEDGAFGRDAVGEHVQIALRQREELRKGAGVLDDAQHRAVGAMAAEALAAPLAMRAGQVDFADHAFAGQRAGSSASTTSATNSCPGVPAKP